MISSCNKTIDLMRYKIINQKEKKNEIKYLLVKRKNTLGYIEFIRGRYNVDDIYSIFLLFVQMTQEEIDRIANNTFDYLWNNLWLFQKNKQKIYRNEYESSLYKFNILRNTKENNLNYITTNAKPKWDIPEWGFPKGRRNHQETDIECALREFKEETNYNSNNFQILSCYNRLHEIFNGTNGIKYKHIYFISNFISDIEPKISNKFQMNEIGDINWFTYEEAMKLIRPYHIEKKKLLTRLHNYLINFK